MNNFTKREQVIILIISALMIFTLGYKIITKDNSNDKNLVIEGEELDFKNFKETTNKNSEETLGDKNTQEEILIHITGEIRNPGIVKLKEGDRIVDAIEKAGGLTSKADQSSINLAQKLFDEDKVNIPEIGQNIEDTNNSIEVVSQGSGVVQSGGSNSNSGGGGKININTASKEELKTLPGVGEATSQKIIDYREITKFSSPEDIMKVSGIGEKKFEAIKDMITVR